MEYKFNEYLPYDFCSFKPLTLVKPYSHISAYIITHLSQGQQLLEIGIY